MPSIVMADALKRAVNAFKVLVNRDFRQSLTSSAQNLRIQICGEMNQNPGKGQAPGRYPPPPPSRPPHSTHILFAGRELRSPE